MLKILHSIFTLILAAVVLFTTTTVTINKHYCGNRLVKTTVIKHNKGCGMNADTLQQQSGSVEKNHCCSDKQLVLEGIDHLQFEKFVSEFDHEFIQSLPLVYDLNLDVRNNLAYKLPLDFHYEPPPLIKPIYRLDEVYLI